MTEFPSRDIARFPRSAAFGVAFILVAALGALPVEAAGARDSASSQGWGEGNVFKPKFEDLVRHADLILLGRVIQVGRIKQPGPSKSRPRSKRYAFWEDSFAVLRLEETLKGRAPRDTVKIAYHSDLEGDRTSYQAGKRYLVFLVNPLKYPDSYTTAHFHFGEYKINDQGKAERVADSSEMSKPIAVVVENVRKALGRPGRSR